jgi:hypothetical protein
MTKREFLADDSVRQIADWLRGRFQSGFVHHYTDRTTHETWRCNGLFEAFRKYRWNNKDWDANKKDLGVHRTQVREAVASDDPQNPDTECRMNAGFVKIYSVLLDYFVMYDGRVGAALGLLVRTFCEQSGRQTVPPALAFAYGMSKEARNAERPKLRNPSVGAYRFPRLSTNSHTHCVQPVRASWLLRETLSGSGHPFSGGEDGFHELGAALFMVGYDLSESQSPRSLTRGQRSTGTVSRD